MNKLQSIGTALILIGALYAGYWILTYNQFMTNPLRKMPMGAVTKEQFIQKYPNLDRAFRFLDFYPFDVDYSASRSQPPVVFIPEKMLRHAWVGIAFFCLGFGLLTFRSNAWFLRLLHYASVICFGASLGILNGCYWSCVVRRLEALGM